MYDVHVIFSDRPGELARFGQLLGRNGVGLEGAAFSVRMPISRWRTGKSPPCAARRRVYRAGAAKAGDQKA